MPLKIISLVCVKMASMCSGPIKIATVVRRYHVYKDIWAAPVGEILFCQQETVAIVEESQVVGHM